MIEQIFEQIYNACNCQNSTQEKVIDLSKHHEEKQKELTKELTEPFECNSIK